MSILTSIPFNWIYGSSIIATFSSGNRIGYRLISPENTIGAWIQIVPLKPNVAPLSNPLTSTTHVQVIITELTVIKTGGFSKIYWIPQLFQMMERTLRYFFKHQTQKEALLLITVLR